MQKFISSLLVAATFIPASGFAQQTKIDVQKGQKYNVVSTSKATSSAEVMGQIMENNADTKTTTIYEITNAAPAEINVNATIINMVVKASAMGQEMSYDSDKKDNDGPLAESITPMINKAKSITINEKGAITKQDASENAGVLGMIGGGGNEANLELFVPALIGKDLKAGESISDIAVVTKDKYSSRDSGIYKINSIDNGVANISYTGTQMISTVMEQMGMEMTNNSNNIVKTDLQMDVKTGMILAKLTVIEMSASVEAGGMTIPVTGKTTASMKATPAM